MAVTRIRRHTGPGFDKESHVVHYGGRVNSDRQEIEGKWWIEDAACRRCDAAELSEESFTLRRQEV